MNLTHFFRVIAAAAIVIAVPIAFADSSAETPEAMTNKAFKVTESHMNSSSSQGTVTKKSKITGGSYSYGAGGNLRMDMAFDGEIIAFDPGSGAAMVVKSGMSKTEFNALAKEKTVPVNALSKDEYQIGREIFVFEDGKLTRSRK